MFWSCIITTFPLCTDSTDDFRHLTARTKPANMQTPTSIRNWRFPWPVFVVGISPWFQWSRKKKRTMNKTTKSTKSKKAHLVLLECNVVCFNAPTKYNNYYNVKTARYQSCRIREAVDTFQLLLKSFQTTMERCHHNKRTQVLNIPYPKLIKSLIVHR